MKEFIINGVKVLISKSDKQNKKLMASFINPKTNNKNIIHFGDNRYKHYFDKSGIWKSLNTMDAQKRRLYRLRHKKDLDTDEPITAGILAYKILW